MDGGRHKQKIIFMMVVLNIIIYRHHMSLAGFTNKVSSSTNGPISSVIKTHGFHQRNKHNGRYDFTALQKSEPNLRKFVSISSKTKEESINWADPEAVYTFNKAMLACFYGISEWSIPPGYLVPPVPSRSDYVHRIADLIGFNISSNVNIKGLDIGCGASCIYPLIATHEYSNWNMVGTDVDITSLKYAKKNALQQLKNTIEIRQQTNRRSIFRGVISGDEKFSFVMCNPPFSVSAQEADRNSARKMNNLAKASNSKASPSTKEGTVLRNFKGISNELFCDGGEVQFISSMIEESREHRSSVGWFTSLVSRESSVPLLMKTLQNQKDINKIVVIEMVHGNKASRILCWTY